MLLVACALSAACWLMCVGRCVLKGVIVVVWSLCSLFVVRCALVVVCCMLHVVRCLLFVDCVLCVGCCV